MCCKASEQSTIYRGSRTMGTVVISGELIQMSTIVLPPTKGETKPNILHPLFMCRPSQEDIHWPHRTQFTISSLKGKPSLTNMDDGFKIPTFIIPSHFIFVTTITTTGCVKKSVKCKIFQWIRERN